MRVFVPDNCSFQCVQVAYTYFFFVFFLPPPVSCFFCVRACRFLFLSLPFLLISILSCSGSGQSEYETPAGAAASDRHADVQQNLVQSSAVLRKNLEAKRIRHASEDGNCGQRRANEIYIHVFFFFLICITVMVVCQIACFLFFSPVRTHQNENRRTQPQQQQQQLSGG